MIEIKSVGGRSLYVAKDATDIKTALQEAVKGGANLDGANLDGANLRGANLRGANLCGANLRGANLGGANLRGANLGGANLRGANLRGANLRGANLDGANLDGANLRGANLDGANLGGANLRGANLGGANLRGANLGGANLGGANLRGEVWEKVAQLLERSLFAMNDSGRHWIKGRLQSTLGDGSNAYCSIGSVEANAATDERTVQTLSLWLLGSVTGGSIADFNDHPSTTWEDVVAVFSIATKHARRFAGVPNPTQEEERNE